MLFILVQIQAGPPAFACFASFGWAGQQPPERGQSEAGLSRHSPQGDGGKNAG